VNPIGAGGQVAFAVEHLQLVAAVRPASPAAGGGCPGCRGRIAWLLRVNRRFGSGGRDVRLATFAARLAATGCPATATQISRWETGRLLVPYRAVAYEKVWGCGATVSSPSSTPSIAIARQRSESTHRLLSLPASRLHVIAACAAVVDDPAVSALLAAQLTEPVSERTLRGALTAGAARVRNRQFSPDQLRPITPAVLDLLTDAASSAAVRPLADELLGNLQPGSRAAAITRLRTGDPALATVVTGGRTVENGRFRR
jgi:hypothetical protein